VSRAQSTQRLRDGTRHGLARHGHARSLDGSLFIHSDLAEAPGSHGRLPRGNRLSLRLHHRRATGGAGAADAQQWIRRLPPAIAAGTRLLIDENFPMKKIATSLPGLL